MTSLLARDVTTARDVTSAARDVTSTSDVTTAHAIPVGALRHCGPVTSPVLRVTSPLAVTSLWARLLLLLLIDINRPLVFRSSPQERCV